MHELTTAAPQAIATEFDFLDREDAVRPVVRTKGQASLGGELHGFYYDMPFEEYAKIDALNGSKVLAMRRSPLAYRYALDNPQEETVAMMLGTITHRMVLEPDRLGTLAVFGREPDQKVRNGKVWEKFKADNADATILSVAEYERVVGMATSALQNAPIRKYAYAPGATEVSIFWRDPATNRRMKARLDKVIDGEDCICDLKTTARSDPWTFGRQAWSMGYVHKMAHYWAGYRILTGREPIMKLLAIESKKPCEGVVYNIKRDDLLLGLEEFERLVYKIADCEKANEWPSAYTDEMELQIPSYAFGGDEDTILDIEL